MGAAAGEPRREGRERQPTRGWRGGERRPGSRWREGERRWRGADGGEPKVM
jgi:hypothetical protein